MDTFIILGWIAIIGFYASYFIKMLLQKRKGIKTNQMAIGDKPRKTYYVEVLLKIITYSTAIAQLASVLLIQQLPIILTNSFVRTLGALISFIGLGFLILAMLTMKDSWRAGINATEKTKFVTSGIYKYSRNPAFLGFDLFYIGFSLMFSNWLMVLLSVCAIIILHLQILEEEKYLPQVFGEEYLEYKKSAGRYLIRCK